MRSYARLALEQYEREENIRETRPSPLPKKRYYKMKESNFSVKNKEEIIQKFKELYCDEATVEFVNFCEETIQNKGDFTLVCQTILHSVLGNCYSLTDTNAMLHRGQMFVLSSAQLSQLLATDGNDKKYKNQLDIGAGDGNVTKQFLPICKNIVTTEVSTYMVKRLKEKGFLSLQTADVSQDSLYKTLLQHNHINILFGDTISHYTELQFDLVTCFNVLDRCRTPLTLLKQIKSLLKVNTGRAVLAVVFPFDPFVENGPMWSRDEPEEKLPLHHKMKWENSVENIKCRNSMLI
eukprot:TRINITY_DN16727_c0_g1_i1.p1 TRINITY_DN16727_c0_g1~~TRINITY_DN16727_c0_g1_i1.p1  ORF type:complete len:293 (-),score=40.08 TRINITY_DN16727_c0_g1_i1:112-990(-)